MPDSLHHPPGDDSDSQPSWRRNTQRHSLEMSTSEVETYCTIQRSFFPQTKRVLDAVSSFLQQSGFVPCEHRGNLSRTDGQMRHSTLLCLGLKNDNDYAYKIRIAYAPSFENFHVYLLNANGQVQPYLSIQPSLLLQRVREMFQ
jgi:hypothetical protein